MASKMGIKYKVEYIQSILTLKQKKMEFGKEMTTEIMDKVLP